MGRLNGNNHHRNMKGLLVLQENILEIIELLIMM